MIKNLFLAVSLLLSAHAIGADTRIQQDLVVKGNTTHQGTLTQTGAATFSSTATHSGNLLVNAEMRLSAQTVSSSGDISSLAATKSTLDFTSASAKTLHGISGGADGRQITIYNSGAGELTIKHASVTEGTAANRFKLTSSEDVVLTQDQGVLIAYISSLNRWIVVGGTGSGGDLEAYFNGTTGHDHDGTDGSGPKLSENSIATNAGDSGKYLKANASGGAEWASVAGGGINFVGLTTTWSPDNADDRDAEGSAGNWATFADAAGASPEDLTGGSASITFSRTNASGEVLNGASGYSFKIAKGASNLQGNGVSVPFNVPPAYQGKLCKASFPYKVISGALATGDATIAIYDVTNSKLMDISGGAIDQTTGTAVAYFTTTPSAATPANQQYRLGVYFASTSTTAATIVFDDVVVEPVDSVQVPNITQWQSYTPTISGFGTVSGVEMQWRQVGSDVEIRGRFTAGTVAASEARLTLPNNYVSAGTGTIPSIQNAGVFTRGVTLTASYGGMVLIEPSTAYVTFSGSQMFGSGNSSNPITKANGSTIASNSDPIILTAKVPIAALQSSTAAVILNPNIGPWQTYTPTFTGFGTVNTQSFRWRQVGESIEIEGSFTPGTPTATEARLSLPNNFVASSSYVTLENAGYAATGTGNQSVSALVEPSVSYLTFGVTNSSTAALVKQSGSAIAGSGFRWSVKAAVRVQGLSAAGVINHPRSEVYVDTGNGSGSTNTAIRRFSNTRKNSGTAITYADSATLGASFTINEDGIYSAIYGDVKTSGALTLGVSVNSTTLTTSIASVTYANGYRSSTTTASSNFNSIASWTGFLQAGDVVRPHHDGTANVTSSLAHFSITKVSN